MGNGDNEKAIVVHHEGSGLEAVVSDDKIVEVARKVEQRMVALRTIVTACIKRTNPNDWVDQQGKPYLMASGAEKLRWPLGISWRFDDPVKEEEEGGHFGYSVKGYFTLQDITIEAIGTRSSKDPFFKKYDYSQGRDKRVELPPSEIDKNDVLKAAITNCIGNGITRLLGIRNMTWEELKDAGLDTSKVARVEYTQTAEQEDVTAHRQEIREKILEMCDGDEKKAGDMLALLTTFVPAGKKESDRVAGKRHVKDLTPKQIGHTLKSVRAEYEKYLKRKLKSPEPATEGGATKPIEEVASEFKIALQGAATLEELDALIGDIVKAGIKGEHYTNLVRTRDIRATELKKEAGKLV